MKIRTSDGIEIFVLPENAKCTESGMSPEKMDKCPLNAFDMWGFCCIADRCDCYTED